MISLMQVHRNFFFFYSCETENSLDINRNFFLSELLGSSQMPSCIDVQKIISCKFSEMSTCTIMQPKFPWTDSQKFPLALLNSREFLGGSQKYPLVLLCNIHFQGQVLINFLLHSCATENFFEAPIKMSCGKENFIEVFKNVQCNRQFSEGSQNCPVQQAIL